MTFYDFLIRHFKNVKSHVFLKSEKKRKIRVLEHWLTVCSVPAHCAVGYVRSLHRPENELILLHVPEMLGGDKSSKYCTGY